MTFVERFTAANGTNLHGRTPSGAGAAFNVTSGSFSIQNNAAQSGAADSKVYINPGITDLIFSVIVRTPAATDNYIYFRWDEAADTGWFFYTVTGTLYYFNGSVSTQHATFAYGFHGNGDQYYFEIDLTDPASITIRAYNLQFSGSGWLLDTSISASSTLNNDKTSVGFGTGQSGIAFDCLRCQEGSYDYPYQGLLEARIQRGIVQNHVSFIISSYDTGIPDQVDVWGQNGTYSPYYDGPSALYQLYDLWGSTDGALFYEAAWKQFQILHDGYYISTADPDYAAQGFMHFSRGPYQDWVRRANQDAYDTVRYLPQRASYAVFENCSITGTDAVAGMHRECAYALAAHVWANKIGGVAASEVSVARWDELRDWCYEWMDYWCDEITPGVYAWSGTERQVAAFMIGLMLRSLWDDYTVSADDRFQATLLKGCNFVWDNFWTPGNSPPGLLYDYNPDSESFGSVGINNDLNNLITAAFAKCAQLTGNQTHMDRADTLNTHVALYGDFTSSGKQKNQATTWLKDYVDWRESFYSAPAVRRSGRLLRRSAA
jgi:hypothetical protein